MCNCVRFSMPREDKTRICETYSEMQCLIDANNYWINHETSSPSSFKPCDCLDNCNNVEYFVRFKKNADLEDLLAENILELPEKLVVLSLKNNSSCSLLVIQYREYNCPFLTMT